MDHLSNLHRHRWGWRSFFRGLAAILFVLAGLNHFRNPQFYREIIPPGFPSPAMLVAISGVCEIAGGVGLLVPSLRRFAGWGLVALLVAVFPANIYMAMHPKQFHIARSLLWIRLPVQGLLVWWVWSVSLGHKSAGERGQCV